LTDQMNLGHMVQGKQRVVSYKVHDRIATTPDEWFIKENMHEATYTQEEFDTVQRLLLRDTRAPQGSKKVYLFAGFLKCADCKKALRRNSAKGITYYVCRTYAEKSKLHCTKHTIREDLLAATVLRTIQAQIALLDDMTNIIEQVNTSPQVDAKKQHLAKTLQEKLREKDRIRLLKDGLYEDWKAGDLDQADYRHMKAKYDKQAQQMVDAIQTLENELHQSPKGRENDALALFLRHKNIHQLDRALLVELVDKIYVHENKEISVTFRFWNQRLC